MKQFDLLAIGEPLLRLSPPLTEHLVLSRSLEKQAGGAELNVLSGVSLLGLRTGIISKIPSNDIGRYVRSKIPRVSALGSRPYPHRESLL